MKDNNLYKYVAGIKTNLNYIKFLNGFFILTHFS